MRRTLSSMLGGRDGHYRSSRSPLLPARRPSGSSLGRSSSPPPRSPRQPGMSPWRTTRLAAKRRQSRLRAARVGRWRSARSSSGAIVVDPPAGVVRRRIRRADGEDSRHPLRGARDGRCVRCSRPTTSSSSRRPSAPNQWGLFASRCPRRGRSPRAAQSVIGRGRRHRLRLRNVGSTHSHRHRERPGLRVGATTWPRTSTVTVPTQRASIAAATNNSIGCRGRRPERHDPADYACWMRHGDGNDVDVAEGIRWAADHGADVINLSWVAAGWLGTCSRRPSTTLLARVRGRRRLGQRCRSAGYVPGDMYYPAKYPGVISVGAVDQSSARASFSAVRPGARSRGAR